MYISIYNILILYISDIMLMMYDIVVSYYCHCGQQWHSSHLYYANNMQVVTGQIGMVGANFMRSKQ